jgi:hypothetical protein
VEQTTRITDRRFVNISGAGILAGGRIEQGDLCAVLGAAGRRSLRDGLQRLRRRSAADNPDTFVQLLADLDAAATNGLVDAWSRFSLQPAETVAQQVAAIAAALRER